MSLLFVTFFVLKIFSFPAMTGDVIYGWGLLAWLVLVVTLSIRTMWRAGIAASLLILILTGLYLWFAAVLLQTLLSPPARPVPRAAPVGLIGDDLLRESV